jgi:lipopolysaccharide export system permease protein
LWRTGELLQNIRFFSRQAITPILRIVLSNENIITMTIIDRYIGREIVKMFLPILAAVAMIYLAVDFFEKVDNFMEADVPLSRLVSFFILKLPLVVSQIVPVCILLTVLITFGLMNKNNEITALKSSGLSVYILLRPVLVIGVAATIGLFLLAEVIVPVTVSKANKIWRQEVKKKPLLASRQKNIWIKGKRSIYFISYFNPRKNTISGISLNYFDADFKLIKRIEARQGTYENGHWQCSGIMEQLLGQNGQDYRVAFYDQRLFDLDLSPQDLKRVVKRSEEMNVAELFAYIQDVEADGYDATIYRVDFHAKFAIPFVCIIMCIMATSVAVKRRIREGISISIAYGIGIIFLYGVAFSFCISIGYGGVLPPMVAAWITSLIFLCLGLINLINAE